MTNLLTDSVYFLSIHFASNYTGASHTLPDPSNKPSGKSTNLGRRSSLTTSPTREFSMFIWQAVENSGGSRLSSGFFCAKSKVVGNVPQKGAPVGPWYTPVPHFVGD